MKIKAVLAISAIVMSGSIFAAQPKCVGKPNEPVLAAGYPKYELMNEDVIIKFSYEQGKYYNSEQRPTDFYVLQDVTIGKNAYKNTYSFANYENKVVLSKNESLTVNARGEGESCGTTKVVTVLNIDYNKARELAK